MEKKVDMSIDEARHDGDVTQIDHVRASGMGNGCTGLKDLFALHQHFARRHDAASLDIEKARRMQHNIVPWRRCLC
jgi:hypothetical protein